jgi:YD repeat-containing protein
LRNVAYAVDGRRNVTGRTDLINNRNEAFSYDALNRLQQWTWNQAGAVAQQVQYNYGDARGNLVSRKTSGSD